MHSTDLFISVETVILMFETAKNTFNTEGVKPANKNNYERRLILK
jgi:hypothetical protein